VLAARPEPSPGPEDKTVKLWDVPAGKVRQTLEGRFGFNTQLQACPLRRGFRGTRTPRRFAAEISCDSGGPSFVYAADGSLEVAAVNTHVFAPRANSSQFAPFQRTSTFGTLGFAQLVPAHANWIDSIIGGTGTETIREPSGDDSGSLATEETWLALLSAGLLEPANAWVHDATHLFQKGREYPLDRTPDEHDRPAWGESKYSSSVVENRTHARRPNSLLTHRPTNFEKTFCLPKQDSKLHPWT
jgi:hypothetical protein